MIDREKVIEGLEAMREFFGFGLPSQSPTFEAYQNILTDALALLKEQPEIVRCQDCKHSTMTADGDLCKYCEMDMDDVGNLREVYHSAYWFCADGERREGR